jgi:hypothetical protein
LTFRTGLAWSFVRSLLLLGLLVAWSPAASAGRGADGKFEKRVSSHFILWQDVAIDRTSGFRGTRRFEKKVLAVLEEAYDRLDDELRLEPARKMEVIVYDPQIFDLTFAGRFGFSAAGFYSGSIHVRGGTIVSERLVRTLHHELVHAAFDAAAPSLVLPAWLNEGVAEWFEARAVGKRSLSAREFRVLATAAQQGQLFSLYQLSSRSFGRMNPEAAQLAYLQSYAFIDYLTRGHGDRSLRELCRTLLRKRDLERAVVSTYRDELYELEAAFVSELRGG